MYIYCSKSWIFFIFFIGFYFSPFLGVFPPIYYFFTFWLNYVRKEFLCKLFLYKYLFLNIYIFMLLFKISLNFFTKLSEKKQINSKLNAPFFVILFLVFLIVLITVGVVFTITVPSKSCGKLLFELKLIFFC